MAGTIGIASHIAQGGRYQKLVAPAGAFAELSRCPRQKIGHIDYRRI